MSQANVQMETRLVFDGDTFFFFVCYKQDLFFVVQIESKAKKKWK